MNLNSKFNHQEFLKNSWQKEPKLIKNFISADNLITPNELAGLACESFVESRLLTENPPIKVQHGPFREEIFGELPPKDWTLLVQSVDHYHDEVRFLKKLFDFVPSWRLDDVMVSYATPGGGVGKHFDHYDVFLVQGEGSRLWQLGKSCGANTIIDDSSGLNLVSEFPISEEFILEQGDALYIPPHISHNGIALTNSLCVSVGFRAPSIYEMSPYAIENNNHIDDPFHRFTNTQVSDKPNFNCEITEKDLRHAFNLSEYDDYEGFVRLFGTLVTEPRSRELFINEKEVESLQDLQKRTKGYAKLSLNPCSRMAFCVLSSLDLVLLFVDGRTYPISINEANLVKEMSSDCCFKNFISKYRTSECSTIVLDLLRCGSLQTLN